MLLNLNETNGRTITVSEARPGIPLNVLPTTPYTVEEKAWNGR
jgi:hypothetical protein